MNIHILNPRKALNKAFIKVKPNRSEIEGFKSHLMTLLERTNDNQSEEFHKNLIADFLKDTYYKQNHFINTKDRSDLVIHNGQEAGSTVGVIFEVKKPTNKGDMIRPISRGDSPEQIIAKLNTKAFQELVLYYLRERIIHHNLEVRHLIITNVYEWYIFDAMTFDRLFAQNKNLVQQFRDFEDGRMADTKTDFFYKHIAAPFIEQISIDLTFTYIKLEDFYKPLRNTDNTDDRELIPLYKVFSPEHLLKLPFANDSNSLDKRFYSELLHIIGLKETKGVSKKLIARKIEGERNKGSLLENAITKLDSLDKVARLPNASQFGANVQERLFNVGLELCITWINRILFLKLLEAQLVTYHKGDPSYKFLNFERITDYDDLNRLFFEVLARNYEDRNEDVKLSFSKVPFLNSSLFEPAEIEHSTLFISQLSDDKALMVHPQSVLKDQKGIKRTGELNALQYLFEFLDAYDFASEGGEEIQEDNKTLINASVLGLIFEKINGYKDGSFFTPGFITMYMCRETIRKAVVEKFNEVKGWSCTDIDSLYDKIEDRNEANNIINSLKICDPAVGSGHFLVSALNEIIAVKDDLKILQDRSGKRLKEYQAEVVNDELIVTDEDGSPFQYIPGNRESHRVQEALFHEKQTIIENCLFGVDINPNSVKICRLRLWIELLKNAYYKHLPGPPQGGMDVLETLPNIDINIKCGNSLVSRFAIDADLKPALKKSKWTIDGYRVAVDAYRNAQDKEQKRAMEQLISKIKTDFKSEITRNDPKMLKLRQLEYEYSVLVAPFLFKDDEAVYGNSDNMRKAKDRELKLLAEIEKLKTEIEEIKGNKIFENAFEWRFEFPEVLNDDGDFVGFDVVIGNPPYIQLSKADNITSDYKNYLLNFYGTSGGRLNTFIFFIHISNKILQKNGYLHFIIPNTILSQEYYSYTRDFLINKVSLSEIVNFSILPFDDAVVETVLIQFINKPNLFDNILVKELTKEKAILVSKLNRESVNQSSKFSFLYNNDPIIEKVYTINHRPFGSLFEINQGIALKGDKSISLKTVKENDNCYRLLDGRNINKYFVSWDGIYLDYDIERIHSCKRKDIFESDEKLMFRRVSSSLIFTYDNQKYFALNTLVIVNRFNNESDLDLKFILGLMNSKLMNYIYKNKFKSTKTVFSEIQARTVKQLPIAFPKENVLKEFIKTVEKIIDLKKENIETDIYVSHIDQLVYELYGLTEEEISIVEGVG